MHLEQRTVGRPVHCIGVGLHSGKPVRLTIHPAPPNHGIKFVRTDLPDHPSLSALFSRVVDTSLATVIGYNGFIVSTIEHLMAAFAGLSIDNARVELDSYEVPVMDGSAYPFTRLILAAGIQHQDALRHFFVVKAPIELAQEDKSVVIYPSDVLKITCSIDFEHRLVRRQTFSLEVTERSFEREISRARTFGFIEEIEYLKCYGFAKGGSLDNAVVLDKEVILNPDGLRYPDEFVRHKLLDCLGDFSLLGLPLLGHVVLHKSGHAFNHQFIRQFLNHKQSWDTCTLPGTFRQARGEPKALAI